MAADLDFDGDGFAAGAAAAISAAGPLLPLRDAEQLDLLRDDRGRLAGHRAAEAVRQRGRPAGATNKRTADVRAYLLSRYAHPLEVLAQIISRPLDTLVAELGCKPVEALAVQARAASELAPYLEGKMPVEVNLTRKADLTLLAPLPGMSFEQTVAAIAEHGVEAIDWSAAAIDGEAAETAEIRHSSGDE